MSESPATLQPCPHRWMRFVTRLAVLCVLLLGATFALDGGHLWHAAWFGFASAAGIIAAKVNGFRGFLNACVAAAVMSASVFALAVGVAVLTTDTREWPISLLERIPDGIYLMVMAAATAGAIGMVVGAVIEAGYRGFRYLMAPIATDLSPPSGVND